MAIEAQVRSDLPIPPGELLAETLDAMNLSQAELARRMGRPVQAINEIVRGSKEITPETAIQLERVLGVPAHVWLGLEAEYRHTKARLDDRKRLAAEADLPAAKLYRPLVRLGWLPKTRDKIEQIARLLDFFGVGSLRNIPEAEAAAYRLSRTKTAQPEALAAWLRKGELEAEKIATAPFNEDRLRNFLPELRQLTMKAPRIFESHVKKALSDCGVALVLLPHLPKTHAHGATRWSSPEKALVQLSLRGKWADIFWFSLFHELGHVLLHGRKQVYIEWSDGDQDEPEVQADRFARDQLIAPDVYQAFLDKRGFSATAVAAFARNQGIHPGIVVGRLQHEGHVPYSQLNHLRTRFEWIKKAE
ncbi:MAG: HigA family addiction module antidote protein [Candidatus Rokubacteria bacterium]|nr:HigA family addiction module antidote protein [Candidatus Rokubacteria bacterium]